jgi:hypothetical protein
MVRAELGNGNRDHALALISRVQERSVIIILIFVHDTHDILDNIPGPSSIAFLALCWTILSRPGRQRPHPKLVPPLLQVHSS